MLVGWEHLLAVSMERRNTGSITAAAAGNGKEKVGRKLVYSAPLDLQVYTRLSYVRYIYTYTLLAHCHLLTDTHTDRMTLNEDCIQKVFHFNRGRAA